MATRKRFCIINKGEHLIQITTLTEWLKIECQHKIKSPDILKKLMYDNNAPTKNEIQRIFLDKSITVYQKANSGDFKKLSRQKMVDILKRIIDCGGNFETWKRQHDKKIF